MYAVDVDLVLRYVPPMSDDDAGMRLTRTIELPFPPSRDISVFSKDWEGIDEPLGYVLKEVTWDMDRNRFLADTELSVTGIPIAMIPFEILQLVYHGWKYGSYKDQYRTVRKRGRIRGKLAAMPACEWDEEEAATWDANPKGRPREFKLILHAVVSAMAELRNNCGVAYAMLKTGSYFDIPAGRSPSELSHLERRFQEAIREYESLSFERQWDWSERVKRRYPRLTDIVAAIELASADLSHREGVGSRFHAARN
ncbi:MAG: hypothetical protein HZA46_00985 [Planctomycetales bacterium]|nr:hypothetical protein [Planctomycetales bacterium]